MLVDDEKEEKQKKAFKTTWRLVRHYQNTGRVKILKKRAN
jgi:hypothetical protein